MRKRFHVPIPSISILEKMPYYKNTYWKLEFIEGSLPRIWHKCYEAQGMYVWVNYNHLKWYCAYCNERFSNSLINFLKLLILKDKIK